MYDFKVGDKIMQLGRVGLVCVGLVRVGTVARVTKPFVVDDQGVRWSRLGPRYGKSYGYGSDCIRPFDEKTHAEYVERDRAEDLRRAADDLVVGVGARVRGRAFDVATLQALCEALKPFAEAKS